MITKKRYLNEMGIDVWQKKDVVEKGVVLMDTGGDFDNLNDLKQSVLNCTLCDLCKTRKNVVFGVGDENAEIMFIGEAPGANEDLKGEPFVGRAGMLLNAMASSIGLKREEVYIANILKCRPPNNRDPSPKEVKLCTGYLQRQIELVNPRVLIAVGRIAAQFLLSTDESMAKLRGNTYSYGSKNTPLVVTYHPAYLLRSPGEKKKAYQDFLLIKKLICRP